MGRRRSVLLFGGFRRRGGAHLARGLGDRLHDVVVAGAAADIAFESVADRRFVDNELARLSVARRVPLQVQHWLSAPEIVKHTNLVSATWEKIAARYSQNGELVMLPLPFGPLKYMFKVYWHRRYEKNAAHRWLRGIVLQSQNHRECVDQAKRRHAQNKFNTVQPSPN